MLIFVLFFAGLFLFSVVYVLTVWLRRRRFTRERFAFAALSAIVTLSLTIGTSITDSSLPWYIVESSILALLGNQTKPRSPEIVDYVLLILVYLVSIYAIVTIFKNWDGLLSVPHHESEQRKQDVSFIREGINEFRRIVFRRDPIPIYEQKEYQLKLDIEAPFGYIPWPERARELVQLRWSHYVFSIEDGWHDNEKCWVGTNLHTKNLVLLRCTTDSVSDFELDRFLKYAETLATVSHTSEPEVVVATENTPRKSRIHHSTGSRLIFETETTLLDGLVDWTEYENDIRKRMSVVRLPDSDLTVDDVYVEPHFSDLDGNKQSNSQLSEYLDRWLKESGQRQVALLGDYGQGKSTAALAFAHREMFRKDRSKIPILIELRGKSPRNLTPLELLGAWGSQYNISARALQHLLWSGRLVVIFEGFDEMALAGDTEARLSHFRTLWEFCGPRSKILITGRPNFFFDDDEMIVSLGIDEANAPGPYCTAIRLHPFDLQQIREALRAHKSEVRDEICGFAESNVQFMELISRPSLLHVVSVLWFRENLSKQLEALTSAYVMDCFVKHSYRRQGLKAQGSREFMALTTEERQYFMKGVATYMASRGLPNQISGRELNDTIDLLVEVIPDDVSLRSSLISREEREPLKRESRGLRMGWTMYEQTFARVGYLWMILLLLVRFSSDTSHLWNTYLQR